MTINKNYTLEEINSGQVVTITHPVHRAERECDPGSAYILQFENNPSNPNGHDYFNSNKDHTYLPFAGVLKFTNPKEEVACVEDIIVGEGSEFYLQRLEKAGTCYYKNDEFLSRVSMIKGGLQWDFTEMRWKDTNFIQDSNSVFDATLCIRYQTNLSRINYLVISSDERVPARKNVNFMKAMRGRQTVPADPLGKI